MEEDVKVKGGNRSKIVELFRVGERVMEEGGDAQARILIQQIIDFLPDATFVIDRQGKVIVWNRAMELLTKVKAEDMMGKGDLDTLLPSTT